MGKPNGTIADIIAEMRGFKRYAASDSSDCRYVAYWRYQTFADRLEAAHKRDIDALDQRRAELNAEIAAKDAVIMRLNDALAEEQRRKMATIENPAAVGDAAKLREALEKVIEIANKEWDASRETSAMWEIWEICKAALAAPARNCDMPLVVDGPADNNADKAWVVFKRHNPDAYFDVPGLLRCIDWLLGHATENEGGAK